MTFRIRLQGIRGFAANSRHTGLQCLVDTFAVAICAYVTLAGVDGSAVISAGDELFNTTFPIRDTGGFVTTAELVRVVVDRSLCASF